MHKYSYPKISGGYRFNFIERCKAEIGISPTAIYDISREGKHTTVIEFHDQLSELQLNSLNSLINNNPQQPPSSQNKTIFVVKDLYEIFDEFKRDFGLNLSIYYSESVKNSGMIDRIEIHCDRILTQPEKNKLRNLYSSLISEKVVF